MHRIFLLSPASTSGKRADLLLNERAPFELAVQVRARPGAPGKLAYARAFARPPADLPGTFVITPSRGLVLPEQQITLADLREFAAVAIRAGNAGYREPLVRDAAWLASRIERRCDVVLLGSVASDRYVEILGEAFGDRLSFPGTFVGRGDMSRGGLMLRAVRAQQELDYIPVAGAIRHGPRPPRLTPDRRRVSAARR